MLLLYSCYTTVLKKELCFVIFNNILGEHLRAAYRGENDTEMMVDLSGLTDSRGRSLIFLLHITAKHGLGLPYIRTSSGKHTFELKDLALVSLC